MQKSVIFVKKIQNKYVKDKKYGKVRHLCYFPGEYRGAVHSTCSLKYNAHKKIPIAFRN